MKQNQSPELIQCIAMHGLHFLLQQSSNFNTKNM